MLQNFAFWREAVSKQQLFLHYHFTFQSIWKAQCCTHFWLCLFTSAKEERSPIQHTAAFHSFLKIRLLIFLSEAMNDDFILSISALADTNGFFHSASNYREQWLATPYKYN